MRRRILQLARSEPTEPIEASLVHRSLKRSVESSSHKSGPDSDQIKIDDSFSSVVLIFYCRLRNEVHGFRM